MSAPAAESPFFAGIAQDELRIRDVVARAPLFYRDAHVMGGFFTADLGAAAALLPTARHRALALYPGRTVVGVHCLEYRHSDIGPYNEVSVAVAAAYGRRLPLDAVRLARAGLTDRYDAYVLTLPVNTEPALWGGLDLFGYPKYLADITFADSGDSRTCTVRDPATGALILEVRGRRIPTLRHPQEGPRPRLRTMSLTSYPCKDGRTLRARMRLNLVEEGASFGRGDLEVTAGPDPRADVVRQLRLGRQLQYLFAPRCEAILERPEAAG